MWATATQTGKTQPGLSTRLTAWKIALAAVPIAVLYAHILKDMVIDWWTVDSLSHGLLIPPLAAYVAWMRRGLTLAHPAIPDNRGLAFIAFACFVLLLGKLGAEFFLARMSFVLLLAGITWTFWGMARLRTLAFPFLLLATMVPLPAIVFNTLAAPLQLFASDVSTQAAQALGVSVYRDGNIIQLASTSLGVAEACSGLNSLSALMVASLLLGFLQCTRLSARVALFLFAIPLSIAVNVVRVTGTAIIADYHYEYAMGFYHSFSGWLVFVAGFGGLYVAARLLDLVLGRGR
jgi:exosortase